jgi:hypothetical protein
MILETAITALFPVLADGARGLLARLTGSRGAQPQNVAEAIQLMEAETQRLTALAQLDTPSGNVHAWVADVRALQRPAAVALVLLVYGMTIYYRATGHTLPATVEEGVLTYAQMVTFYLFGDRSYAYLRGKK